MRRSLLIELILGVMGAIASPAVAAQLEPIKQEAKTAHYRLELLIGPTEKMFTPAEAAAQHPTEGEVMVGGMMSMDMPMDMGDVRHIEVQVYPPGKDEAVNDADVAISVTDTASRKVEDVAVVRMYGIEEGPSDIHYGNNVSLATGNYIIQITVNGEKAEFTVAIPGS